MNDALVSGALLFSPLFVGMLAHGLCIRFGFLRGLAVPIDRGRLWRGRRLFGDNKTYRGLLAVAVGTALGFLLLSARLDRAHRPLLSALPSGGASLLLGFAVGLAGMLSELPNSALKRQLDVRPGTQAGGIKGLAFHVLDQVDVLLGAWLVLAVVIRPTFGLVLGSALFVYVGHQLITLIGYGLGMRATRR